jgi:preprotein translocase subunit SecD
MYKNLRTKVIVTLAVVVACLYFVIGLPTSAEELAANFRNNIRLGLDLRGGSHLVLQIQVQDAFKADADQTIQRLQEELARQGIGYTSIQRNDPRTIEEAETIQIDIAGVPLDSTGAFRQVVTDFAPQYVLTGVNSTDYRLTVRPTDALAIRSQTVQSAINTIEKRVNGLGLTEATVRQRGSTDQEAEILVEMPGVDDPARVKQILQTTALLEIVLVQGGPFASMESARSQYSGVLPLNTRLLRFAGPAAQGGGSFYLVSRTTAVTGRDLRNARVSQDEFGRPATEFTLSPDGGRRFGRFTESNIGKPLAVVLDEQIRNVATIQSRIEDTGQITGIGSVQESADLALVLRAGSLPAGVSYLEERTVGPSLGADSIRQGLQAGIAGVLAVILVMLLYYRKAGINATIALVINAIILIGVLAYAQAVLTLPGIAGIVLTVGMAVDSNVLIFERIREELRGGKSIAAAIEAGFNRAMLTIIDTHVTTVVSCAFLFIFGNSAVRGFAVTLVIGLLANFFTAVYVSKAIFEWQLNRNPKMVKLSI